MVNPTIKPLAADTKANVPFFRFQSYEVGADYYNDGRNIDFVTDGNSLYVCAVEHIHTTANKISEERDLLKLVSEGKQGIQGVAGKNGLPGETPDFQVQFDGKQLIVLKDGVRKAVSSDLTGPSWKPVVENETISWERTYDAVPPESINLNDLRVPERPILFRTNSDNTKRQDETSGPAVFIQWKYEGDQEWRNLISISELMNLALAGVNIWPDADTGKLHFGHREVVSATYSSGKNGKTIISNVKLGEVLFDAGELPYDDNTIAINNILEHLDGIDETLRNLPSTDLSEYLKKTEAQQLYQPKGNYVKSVKINGTSHTPNANTGEVDLGTISGGSDVTGVVNKIVLDGTEYTPVDGTIIITLSNKYNLFDLNVRNGHLYKTVNGVETDLGEIGEDGSDWTEAQIRTLITGYNYLTRDIADTLYLAKGTELGDKVSVQQILATGTRIATITVNGQAVNIYAPSDGGTTPVNPTDLYYRTFMIYQRTDSNTRVPVTTDITSAAWDLNANALVLTSATWTNSPENATSEKPYLWMTSAAFRSDTRSIVGNWSTPICLTGENGEGVDGSGIEFIFRLVNETEYNTIKNIIPEAKYKDNRDDDFPETDNLAEHQWSDSPISISPEYPIELAAIRTSSRGVWQTTYSQPFIWSRWGEDGVDGDGTEYIFYAGTELPSTNLPSSWTNDADFQTQEYIRESARSIWFDNPVDLNASEYGMGTKQWVCIRKKYADPNTTDATWHAYSTPALWSYYAQDGDAGTGVIADSDNDTIVLSLKADGYNNELTQQSVITIYNGATAVATTVTNVSVKDSLNNTYPSQTWITYSGNIVTATFPENAINLSDKQLLVTVTATAVVDGEPVTRNIVITILGVHFGSDGVSYKLGVSSPVIHRYANGSFYQNSLYVWCTAVRGTTTVNTYTPSNISELGDFYFTWIAPGMATERRITKNAVSLTGITEWIEINLYYGETRIDYELIYVVSDGQGGGYYESIFRAVAKGSTTPTLPTNGIALPSGSPWAHSAQNSDGSLDVWMASRWVYGDGTYDNWQGPWIISGSTGDAGIDGDTHEYIYAITINETVSPADPNSGTASTASQATSPTQDDFVPEGWTDSPQSIDENNRVEWVSIRTKEHSASNPTGTWTAFSTPVPWSSWGRTGTDGDGVEYIYYAGSTYPAVEPSSWSITNTEYQNTREYRAEGSNWRDNPVNLDAKNNGADVYPAGSKQWVCVRKKFADSTPHETFGTNPYWHAYTSPALWSYKAKDGDTGLGVVADLDNDMMAVALKQNGMNYTFSQEAEVSLYNGAAEVPCTITDVQVVDSDGTDITALNYVVVANDIVTVDIDEDAINLSQKHLLVYLTVEGNVTIGGTTSLATRTVTLTIIGVHFGTDGASYRLVTTAPVIRKSANNTLSPSQVNVFVTKTSGTSEIESFTPSELIAANRNFRFKYAKNNSSQETSFTTDYVSTSGITSNLRIELDYVVNGSEVMIDQETIPVIVDGTNGENAGRLDLDNENDSILYDSEGNPLSDPVVSTAKLYIGSTDMTSSATDWSVTYTNCSGTNSNNVITVSSISRSAASARISCVYDNVTYSAILSLKKIVGTVKYDLLVSPTAIAYDPVSDTASSATVDVYVYRTSQQSRARITSLPSGYVLKVDGETVDYRSSGYNFNVNIALRSHTVNLWNGSELVDEETIPILSGVDPSSIEPAVAPFRGEFSLSETYYGSKDRTDIVYDSTTGTYYIAKQSAPSSPFKEIPLSNDQYWKAFGANYENIATGFLFAERITANRLETVDENGEGIVAAGNELYMTDSTRAQRLRITGDSISTTAPGQSYPVFNQSKSKATVSMNTQQSYQITLPIATYNVLSTSQTVTYPTFRIAVGIGGGVFTGTLQLKAVRRSDNVTVWSSILYTLYAQSTQWSTETKSIGTNPLINQTAGVYDITAELNFTVSANSSAWYAIQDATLSSVFVSNNGSYITTIGSNGMSVYLGDKLYAIFTSSDTESGNVGNPSIKMCGFRSSDNREYGIKLQRGELLVKEADDDGYYSLGAKIQEMIDKS